MHSLTTLTRHDTTKSSRLSTLKSEQTLRLLYCFWKRVVDHPCVDAVDLTSGILTSDSNSANSQDQRSTTAKVQATCQRDR